MKPSALVISCLLAALPAAGENWPSFRGPGASGVAESATPPLEWNVKEGKNVRWTTPIPGFSHASPVVWGDKVFVATAVHLAGDPSLRTGLYGDVDVTTNEGEISWRMLALDRATGKVLWDKEVAKGKAKVDRHIKATHANSTPATDGKMVVVLFGSEGGLYGLDLDGNVKWRAELGGLDTGWFYDPSYQWGHSSSPVIWRDRVIVQVDRAQDSFLAAYSLADGKQLWRTARPEISSWGTPTPVPAGERWEIATNGGRAIRGYDPETGAELWKVSPTTEVTVATPIFAHGLIFVSEGYRPLQPVYAIRPGGRGDLSLKEGQTSSEQIPWATMKGGTYIPTPIVVGEQLYTLGNGGALTCYEAKTGKELYKQRVGSGRTAFTASPVAAGNRVYLSSEDGDVYVFEAGAAYKSLSVSSMGETIMATPAITGDLLLVRTGKHLVALGETKAPAAATGSP
ncbi:MAG TPA: PQQ-binding-like beta-propeller repeat protein [Thermoanaerobaculia bacterium]|nr:PQQ-binding-like beta-propeller repeat protein [Thermoanaerobaculia bacterium]